MKEKTEKPLTYKTTCVAVVFTLLFAVGVLIGSRYAGIADTEDGLNTVLSLSSLNNADGSLPRIYSTFLFDHIFYLLIVFLFGMTFLGTVVIPVTVALKGLTIGISFSYLLLFEGDSIYLQKWLSYFPAALCAAVFILFSAYAYGVSLKFCGFLQNKEAAAVSLKGYGMLFIFILLILAAAGAVHCILNLLSVILF